MKKSIYFPDRTMIEAEACAWIAQLDGDQVPSREDLAALHEWISRSPLHRAEIERLSDLWGDMNILTELATPLDKPQHSQTDTFLGRLIVLLSSPGRLTAMSAILLFSIAAVVTFWGQNETGALVNLTYSTEVGVQRMVKLPDGSMIELNTNTQVEVDYNRERRKIRLLRGHAHFDINYNPDKPFIVYAGANLMRAVGTAFSVRLRDTDIEVIVTEGRVELAWVKNIAIAGDSSIDIQYSDTVVELAVLKAGQRAIFKEQIDDIRSIEKEEMARKLSWRDGMLIFSGESLEFVIEEVSRYTPISIEFLDPGLRDLRIGGYFRVGETEALFEALETNFNVQVSYTSDYVVQLSTNKQ